MNDMREGENQGEKAFPATVAKIIDPCKVVMNRGVLHGVKEGQRFLVYKLSEEVIVDPASGESLGYLEIVKGRGRVSHVQEKMSIVESDRREPVWCRLMRSRSGTR